MRPKKYIKARYLTICLDDKDVDFLDDHRGKVTRGDYLIHSMYALRPEQSDQLKEMKEKDQRNSQEIHELKKQILFLQSRLGKQESMPAQDDPQSEEWFKKLEANFRDAWNTDKSTINWRMLHEKNPDLFRNAADMRKWVQQRIENSNNEGTDNKPDTEHFQENNTLVKDKIPAVILLSRTGDKNL